MSNIDIGIHQQNKSNRKEAISVLQKLKQKMKSMERFEEIREIDGKITIIETFKPKEKTNGL
jgi:hypothetical protein